MKNLAKIFIITSSFLISLQAKPTTLIMHHFLGPNSPVSTKLLEPWARDVERLSNGELKIEIYPSMSMGGKPNELYKQVRDGTADIVYTIAGYTPGVFSRTEVYELPTVHKNSSLNTALAIKENYDLIKDDYKAVKPLLIAVSGSYQLHTVEKKITKQAELKNLKVRSPSRTGAWYIEELGAEPVATPISDVTQSLYQKVIDGAILPMEMFPSYKFHESTKYTTELKGGGGFGASILLLLMNQKKFNNLPKNAKIAIEKASGKDLIHKFSDLAYDYEEIGKKLQIESGGEIITLSDEESAKFDEAGARVVDRWIKEMKSKNIDGQKIADTARKSISK